MGLALRAVRPMVRAVRFQGVARHMCTSHSRWTLLGGGGTAGRWAPAPCDARASSNDARSAEWTAAGLGATRADPYLEPLNRLLFVQVGFGCDQHGDRTKGSTKAAMRAIRDAISFNSIPGMAHAVPGGRQNMLIHVKIGVPPEFPSVDLEQLASVFPYGRLLPIEVVVGGLTFGSGRVVPELGDTDDTAIVSNPFRPPARPLDIRAACLPAGCCCGRLARLSRQK